MDKNCVVEKTNELYRLTLLFPKKEPLRFKMRELADEVLANFITHFDHGFEPVNSGVVKNSCNLFEVLDSFFEVAKRQNWVKPSDILNLQQEYRNIKQALPSFLKENLGAQGLEGQREKEEIVETASAPIQFTQGIRSIPLPEPLVMPEPSATRVAAKGEEEDLSSLNIEESMEESMEESNTEVSDRQRKILDILKQKEGIQVWEVKDILPDVSKRTLRRDFKKLLNGGLVERKGDKNTTFYKLKVGRTD